MSTVNGDEAYVPRMSTGIPGLDLQLGGGTRLTASGCESDFGLVRPSFVVLAGPPGVGKSRVLWQIVRKVTADCASVLCVSDAMRADDEVRANVRVRRAWAATLRQLGHDVRRHRPAVLILDGLQDVLKNEPLSHFIFSPSASGSLPPAPPWDRRRAAWPPQRPPWAPGSVPPGRRPASSAPGRP